MAGAYLSAFLRHVRGLVGGLRAGPTEDELLLERFVSRGDQAAFAALVERHGALVLGVCRRVLRHEQDAEDAFQAAFLVLARKAPSIRNRRSLGAWLHGVAARVARKARDSAARQRGSGQGTTPVLHADPCDAACRAELRALLDDALRDVPEKWLARCFRSCAASVVEVRTDGDGEGQRESGEEEDQPASEKGDQRMKANTLVPRERLGVNHVASTDDTEEDQENACDAEYHDGCISGSAVAPPQPDRDCEHCNALRARTSKFEPVVPRLPNQRDRAAETEHQHQSREE